MDGAKMVYVLYLLKHIGIRAAIFMEQTSTQCAESRDVTTPAVIGRAQGGDRCSLLT